MTWRGVGLVLAAAAIALTSAVAWTLEEIKRACSVP